jgi:hypothetical protein
MKHEEALELVHAMHERTLEAADRRDLDAHLADCARCRGVADTYALVFDTLQEENTHLAIDEIVSYATHREPLTAAERERVEQHVASCESCADDLARVERVHASIEADPGAGGDGGPTGRSRWSGPASWVTLAAAIAALALVYPAYLGIVRWPETASRASEVRAEQERLESRLVELRASAEHVNDELERMRDWSGPVELELVTSTLRGADAPMTVELDPSRPFVLLGIQVAITGAVPDDAPIRFELADPSGTVARAMTTAAGEARDQVRSVGVVTWLVPTASLSPGKYRLRVVRDDLSDGPVLLEVPVEILDGSP